MWTVIERPKVLTMKKMDHSTVQRGDAADKKVSGRVISICKTNVKSMLQQVLHDDSMIFHLYFS